MIFLIGIVWLGKLANGSSRIITSGFPIKVAMPTFSGFLWTNRVNILFLDFAVEKFFVRS
jgi:prepilin-type processing-associated H-X9-DG protein